MAQIQNVITTTFKARGGQAIAEMGGIGRAARGMTNEIYNSSRMSERFQQQWRAIGTTIRYALAGGVIFGLRGMVTQLRDVQTQLGLMAAIGTQPGGGIFGRPFSSGQITKLGFNLQQASVNSLTPINQLNDATVSFLSTVQNANPGQIPKIMQILAQGAMMAQTPVSDLTQMVTSMNNAFGRPQNLQTIGQVTRQWQALIKLAPGGIAAGSQIAQQLGPLSQVALLGASPNVPPEQAQSQLMSLALASLRFGGTPATNLRGLQYFLQSLAQPSSKQGRQILGSMGITPQFMHDKGFYAGAIKFLQGISTPGQADIKRMNQIPEDQLSEMDTSGAGLPGIPAAEMIRLRQALGRVHAVRAAVTLAYQLHSRGNIQSLQELLQAMNGVQQDQTQFAQSWQQLRKRSQLQAASVAVNNLSLQIAQTLEPLLNFGAGKITGLQALAHRHPRATRDTILGAAGALAGVGIYKFLGGKSGIMGAFGMGAVRARAAEAMATGGAGKTIMDGLGNDPANPLYVVVVGQLFNAPGRTGGTGKVGTLEKVAEATKKYGWIAPLGAVAAAAAFTFGANRVAQHLQGGRTVPHGHPLLSHFTQRTTGGMDFNTHHADAQQQGVLDAYAKGQITADVAEGRLRTLSTKRSNIGRLQHIMDAWNPHRHNTVNDLFRTSTEKIGGRMYATFDVNLKFPDGSKQNKRIHVPVDIWTGGKAPSHRAQPGNSRSN